MFTRIPHLRSLLPLFLLSAAMGQDTVGSKACSGCHAQIYRKYSATSMSVSSGKVAAGAFRENFDGADFSDPALGADYRVSVAPEGYRLEFSRTDSGVRGQRLLGWFVGSGRVARSYLSSLDGFLFQGPSPFKVRLEAVRANSSPAFAVYQMDSTGTYRAAALHILTIENGEIIEVNDFLTFDGQLFIKFGLPLVV